MLIVPPSRTFVLGYVMAFRTTFSFCREPYGVSYHSARPPREHHRRKSYPNRLSENNIAFRTTANTSRTASNRAIQVSLVVPNADTFQLPLESGTKAHSVPSWQECPSWREKTRPQSATGAAAPAPAATVPAASRASRVPRDSADLPASCAHGCAPRAPPPRHAPPCRCQSPEAGWKCSSPAHLPR